MKWLYRSYYTTFDWVRFDGGRDMTELRLDFHLRVEKVLPCCVAHVYLLR